MPINIDFIIEESDRDRYIEEIVGNSSSCHALKRHILLGESFSAAKKLRYAFVEDVLRAIPCAEILRKRVISYGDLKLALWISEHIRTIAHSISHNEVLSSFFREGFHANFANVFVSLLEQRINKYMDVYKAFEALKLIYVETGEDTFNEALEEAMQARREMYVSAPEVEMKLEALKVVVDRALMKHRIAHNFLTIDTVYADMGQMYLFEYMERLMSRVKEINYKRMSKNDAHTLDVFYSVVNKHWNELLRNEIYLDGLNMPCHFLFERIQPNTMDIRDCRIWVYDIVISHVNLLKNYVLFLLGENYANYHVSFDESPRSVWKRIQKVPEQMIRRKVGAVSSYTQKGRKYQRERRRKLLGVSLYIMYALSFLLLFYAGVRAGYANIAFHAGLCGLKKVSRVAKKLNFPRE
ncbi:uncharacterized protein NEMAJ01_1543 [Nematocida major]|uniref:uncharacterized protein n=1 Tax=Nematocida major TaxID=1912982 RepID=UPI002008C801|nr:uncharacterized protein NEMAJ01_1543 [Nematocida major]KAH9386647.1 hypothetical protein NEMAJ01_1543 [Nematocida major]